MTAPDFTLFDVLAWARTKPADERYCYASPSNCALCQFLRETGRAVSPGVMPHVEGFPEYGYWDDATSKRYPYPAAIEPALESRGTRNWTFGALATRLEALCPGSEWVRVETYMDGAIGSATVAGREPSRSVSALRATTNYRKGVGA